MSRRRSSIRFPFPTRTLFASLIAVALAACGDSSTSPGEDLASGTTELTATGALGFNSVGEAFHASVADPDGSGLYLHALVLTVDHQQGAGFVYLLHASNQSSFPQGTFPAVDLTFEDVSEDDASRFLGRFGVVYLTSGAGGIPVVGVSNSGSVTVNPSGGNVRGELQVALTAQVLSLETGEADEVAMQLSGGFNAVGGVIDLPFGF